MHSLIRLALLLAGLIGPCLAQRTPDPARVEACLKLLQCESAPKLATAAYCAAEERLGPVAEKIAELAKAPPPTMETGLEREYVFRAFADALFMCEVTIESEALAALQAEGAPVKMLLAVASGEPKLAEDWLMSQVLKVSDFESWSVAMGLLVRARSGALAAMALGEVDREIEVRIDGPKAGKSGPGGFRGGKFRAGRGETRPPEGFPRLIDYSFTPIPREGDFDLKTEGLFKNFVRRGTLGKGISSDAKTKGDWRVPIAYREALELMSSVEMPDEVLKELSLSFPEDVLPDAVDNRVYLARKGLAAWYWEVVAKLVEKEVLPAKQARKLRPRFRVKVDDQRGPGAKRLPKLDKTLARPAWLSKLK